MPVFFYKAKNKTAETVNGQVIAETKEEAVEKVIALSLIPVSVSDTMQAEMSSATPAPAPKAGTTGRVGAKEASLFSRQLASLLKTGTPLLRALEILAKQMANRSFQVVIFEIIRDVKDGKSLADAMSRYPRIFSPLYTAMINSGEESGQLREILSYMSDYLRTQDEIMSRVKTAMAYPAILLVLGLGTVVFLLTFVMPRITSLFVDLKQSLPTPTVILIFVSDFLRHSWMAVGAAVLMITFAVKRWIVTPAGHQTISRLQMQLPILGPLIIKVETARFCRSMEMLLKSGVSILRAIKLSVPLVSNDLVRRDLERCHRDLSEGSSLGQSLKQAKYIPSMTSDMIAIGEEAGTLSQTLQNISEEYEQEIGRAHV